MNRLVLSGLVAVLLGGCAHASSTKAPFETPLKWTASDIVVGPVPDGSHPVVAVKDPSIVRYNNKWHIYATTASTNGAWGMEYISFSDWKDAAKANPYFLDDNPNLRGYHCAPQVFYFTPQKKWYLIFQSQHPQYSTTDDLSKPETWSRPENFFENMPSAGLRLDYWVICDDTHAYLFATGDDGNVYRSRTKIQDFPKGMSDFETVISGPRNDVFEGGMTYKIKGTKKYLTLVEAIGPARYYRAWIADSLDGEWTELDGANSWETPFAGMNNVTFADGVTPWTTDISHGELIREGYDETPTIDPKHLQLLFQGYPPSKAVDNYILLPYTLGVLTLDRSE